MKIKVTILILILCCVPMLFSFSFADAENKNATQGESKDKVIDTKMQENENIYLQNTQNITLYNENSSKSSGSSENASDELSKIYDSFIGALPEGVPYNLEDISGALGVGEMLRGIVEAITSRENVKVLIVFVAIGILFSLAELFSAELGDAAATARAASAVILFIPIFNLMRGLIFDVVSGLSGTSELFEGIIPALTGILAIGSGSTAASVSGAAMSASLGFVTGVLSEGLLPLSVMMFSVSMLSGIDTGGITDGAAKGIRSIFNFIIGISSLIIVATLGAQTVIATSADNLATKSAKYALSGMIPVVGSTVSGALSSLISGVKLLSVTVGTVSVIALLSVVTLPLLRLLFFRFCLFICITLSSFSGGSFGQRFFGSVRAALDTVIAVFASSVLIYLLEIIIVTSSIKGAL